MSTITIGLSGSTLTGLGTNPSKSFTVSDTDLQALLDWAKVAFNAYIQATYNSARNPAFVPTNGQVLLAWIQNWTSGTKMAVQQFKTTAPVVPAPIVMA